jgi:hypothetical protein
MHPGEASQVKLISAIGWVSILMTTHCFSSLGNARLGGCGHEKEQPMLLRETVTKQEHGKRARVNNNKDGMVIW